MLRSGAEVDVEDCGARRWHGPWQGPRQADGARSQREAQVRARGASGGGTGEDGSVPRAETRSTQSEWATRAGAAQAGSVLRVGDADGVRPYDGRSIRGITVIYENQ